MQWKIVRNNLTFLTYTITLLFRLLPKLDSCIVSTIDMELKLVIFEYFYRPVLTSAPY